jgi:ethanolamine utilization protein EutN
MVTGRVLGSVVCTAKDENLTGIKLLIVQLYENGTPGKVIVAADAIRVSGYGDHVYLMTSKEAAMSFRRPLTPVDAAIMGYVDEYHSPSGAGKG